MTPRKLSNYLRKWYKEWMVDNLVDTVLTEKGTTVFGSPSFRNNGTVCVAFRPYKNGAVAVRTEHWDENAKRPEILAPWEKYDSVDVYMEREGYQKSEKPSVVRNNYRY